jgi:DNA-binding NarL/FixJ family response regulator
MLVDDNREFREVLAALLPRIFDVEIICTFERADAALEHLHTHPVENVLVDYKMPGIDGITFIERTRALNPPPRVFLVSFSPFPDLRETALRAGAAGVINKTEVQEELKDHFPPLKS